MHFATRQVSGLALATGSNGRCSDDRGVRDCLRSGEPRASALSLTRRAKLTIPLIHRTLICVTEITRTVVAIESAH